MTYTKRQLQILRVIWRWNREEGVSPTLREIAEELNISDVTVFEHVKALESKGAITKCKHQARSIEIVDDNFDGADLGSPEFQRKMFAACRQLAGARSSDEADGAVREIRALVKEVEK